MSPCACALSKKRRRTRPAGRPSRRRTCSPRSRCARFSSPRCRSSFSFFLLLISPPPLFLPNSLFLLAAAVATAACLLSPIPFTPHQVVPSKAVLGRKGFDVFSDADLPENSKIKIKKTEPVSALLEEISAKVELAPENMRLWRFQMRQGYVSRPETVVTKLGETDTIEKALGIRSYYLSSDKATLLVQEVPNEAENRPSAADCFLVVKYFDPQVHFSPLLCSPLHFSPCFLFLPSFFLSPFPFSILFSSLFLSLTFFPLWFLFC